MMATCGSRHGRRHLPRSNVHERSRRVDDQHPEQKLELLCGVDPEHRQVCCLWNSSERAEDINNLHRKLESDLGTVQEDL